MNGIADRAGAVLLEALVAVTVVAFVAGAAVWGGAETIRDVSERFGREGEIRSAHRLMTAVALWPVADLDRHLGESEQGSWLLQITREGSTLYHVTIARPTVGGVALETWLFRESRWLR